ncbi:MAG: hypothetical protein COW00_04435 [Bdellovibrio sp. CG12_big_fil_rev_8_21_14_0_65_39_13]|nr:MAG: hypothetical protein COW78_12635 [Bdellovibrio sp. CG22_combo_CG10-13_8_21_14_all_39_27]PIQ61057.1 MAG: hypothetical protein COW00_04435 [Bdellovibrio sp. CG12_big_fil_rev_8_21_14_0_65_39_13]PIR36825.1 MAG: hypothetical protein COV37_01455 [Bdellovibrio sp. CG11_big_fil_rev_8_21_14_0_20_39_38]
MKIKFVTAIIIAVQMMNGDAFAFEYTLGKRKFDLPLPKEWLAKSPKKDSLVFFDAKESQPRPIISVYSSPFEYPKDLSVFEGSYKMKKKEWVTEVDAKENGTPKFEYFKEKKTVLISYFFEINKISYVEEVSFQECDKDSGMALKILRPVKSEMSQSKTLLKSKLCQP